MRMGRRRVQLNSGAGYGLVLCVGCRGLLRCSDQGVAVVEGCGVSAMRREQAVAMRQPPPQRTRRLHVRSLRVWLAPRTSSAHQNAAAITAATVLCRTG